jgi:hypothetical protein
MIITADMALFVDTHAYVQESVGVCIKKKANALSGASDCHFLTHLYINPFITRRHSFVALGL